jgi:hypothetical protein
MDAVPWTQAAPILDLPERLGGAAALAAVRKCARAAAYVRLMPPSIDSTCPVTHVTPGSESATIQ